MLTSQNQVRTAGRVYAFLGKRNFAKKFSWRHELKELCSFKFLNIIWWPLFKYRQRYFTHSPFLRYCKTLPGFTNLWNTIQKGSFAYNCLFLGIRPYQRSCSSTDLADITTLALFFGDELIDGVCKTAGKNRMRELLNKNPGRFYLKKKVNGQQVKLVYRFNLNHLLTADVMEQMTPKYGISYTKFYYLLEQFLQLMNDHLEKLPFAKAQLAADKIMDVCNTCLESYLHDVNSDPVAEQIREVPEVLHFHETKTRYMQEKLLELRCILANKEEMMNSRQTQGWLDIMRIVQIYDDLQDVLEDETYQDNLVISVAYHKFSHEWTWLQNNKAQLQNEKQIPFVLSLHMPQTIYYCLELASERMRTMNWEQQKIMHYLLFRNWFVERNEEVPSVSFANENFPAELFLRMKGLMPGVAEQEIKAHLIHSCFHVKWGRKWLKKKLSFPAYYQLRYNLLNVSCKEKSGWFDRASK